jgi:hypothetical protein
MRIFLIRMFELGVEKGMPVIINYKNYILTKLSIWRFNQPVATFALRIKRTLLPL